MSKVVELPNPNVLISTSPGTGEELGRLPVSSPADIAAAFEKAQKAQTAWTQVPVRRRVKIFEKLRDQIVQEQDDIIALISAENGKSNAEALIGEILSTVDTISYFCDRAVEDLKDEAVSLRILKTQKSVLMKMPFGVVAVISPWNYPFYLTACSLIPALLAGNSVLYKPSEFTPLIGKKMVDLCHQAGVPADVLQLIVGDGRAGAAILDQPIHKVCFTGSVATGKKIMAKAAEKPIPVCLELGGKDAMIVLEDADIERAARGAVWGGFANCGQICASVERVFVHEKVYESFLDRVVTLTKELQVGGDPQSYDVGPMIHERQLQIVDSQIRDAVKKGAQALTGGHRLEDLPGTHYAPTVLVGVEDTMNVMREESFGPVLPVVKIHSEEEAIRRTNDCDYGLTASVWTRDEAKALRIARQLYVGNVTINDHLTGTEPPEVHWGGVKQSGVGRTRGATGLKDFVYEKHVAIDRLALSGGQPFWFPRDKRLLEGIKRGLYLFSNNVGTKVRGLLGQ